jgi:hypothetical protein
MLNFFVQQGQPFFFSSYPNDVPEISEQNFLNQPTLNDKEKNNNERISR